MIVLSCAFPARAADFAGGAGTPADPYQIAMAEQLVSIGADANLLDKYFILVSDIDLDPNLPGGQAFTQAVIAPDENLYSGPRVAYTGRFYGQGHTIRRLTIDGAGMQYLGLFGRIGSAGRVYDLVMEDVHITAVDHAGGLAGLNEGGVTNCSVTGSIRGVDESSWLGGLAGVNTGTILDSRADVTLTAGDRSLMLGLLVGMHRGGMATCQAVGELSSGAKSHYLGGLAGACIGGLVRDSHASGHLAAGEGSWALGGLAGRVDTESVLTTCYAIGAVRVDGRGRDLGGFIGSCFGAEMANCYATGDVTGGEDSYNLGGLLGSCVGVAVRNGYATGTVSGFRTLGGFIGRAETGTWLSHCHAVGRVLRGSTPLGHGGFVGRIDSPSGVRVTGCFWDVEASQATESAAGDGLTTIQMQNAPTFQAAGWDMAGERAGGTADLWLVPPGGSHPVLVTLSESHEPYALTGSGTSSDPYRIATAEDLGAMGRYSHSAWYRLVADIDLSGIRWSAPPVASFNGVFDGRGYRIRGLTLQAGAGERLGLFGRIESDGWVFDVGLEEVTIDVPNDSRGVGGLAGENAGHVSGCYVKAIIAAGANCRNVGGLIGVNWLGVVSDCYTITEMRVATGSTQIGGLLGYNYMGILANCYTAGRISGDAVAFVAALTGQTSEHAATTGCYYLAASAGGGPDHGAGAPVTAERMKQRATFVDWDFANTWTICEGEGYPHLQWEGIDCAK